MRLPRLGIGPSLEYAGAFHKRATLQPMPGVRVEFRRTGGIPVQPETFTAVTDGNGVFTFPLVPLANGTEGLGAWVRATPRPGCL